MRGLLIGGTLFGLVIGIGIGLLLSWVYWPVTYVDVDPVDLRLDTKDDYQRMIAAAYSLNGDLRLAWARLARIYPAQPGTGLAALAARESRPSYQQALVHLVLDLQQPAVALARPTYTPRPTRTPLRPYTAPTEGPRPVATVTPTRTPVSATATIEPTAIPPTSVPNPDAPAFEIKTKASETCLETGGRTHIQVQVEDENGAPLPGIGVEVNWDKGDEILYTGLKPERGMGYADLTVKPGAYNVRLAENAQSPVIEGLKIDTSTGTCASESTEIYGWRLVFAKK